MKIEINIEKRHLWAMIGVIVLLFGAMLVIAKTTTPAWTSDQKSHDVLYADTIAGKSGGVVTVDDDLVLGTRTACSGKLYTDATGKVQCGVDATGAGAETDPQVAATTSGKWCIGTGSAVTCTEDAPMDISSCQICIQCNYDGGAEISSEQCIGVNEGWSGFSGDLVPNNFPNTDNAQCRIRMSCS